MNHLEQLVEEWLSLCVYSSSSQEAEILRAAVAGIPRVAQAIAAIPAEHRASAFDAAEHSYLQTAKDLGGADEFAENWAAAIMQQLRAEVEQREPANTKLVKALHDGPLPAEFVREPAFDLTHFSRSKS